MLDATLYQTHPKSGPNPRRNELAGGIISQSKSPNPRAFSPRFFVFLSLFTLPAASSSSDSKVSVDLYYESLCPSSANFVVNYLAKLFDNGLISIVDLRLIPYGNAKVKPNGSISCQHGPNECLLNTVEACAISAWSDLSEHFSFI